MSALSDISWRKITSDIIGDACPSHDWNQLEYSLHTTSFCTAAIFETKVDSVGCLQSDSTSTVNLSDSLQFVKQEVTALYDSIQLRRSCLDLVAHCYIIPSL